MLLLLPGGDVTDAWVPTLSQLAAILRSRTRGVSSRDASVAGEQDMFTTTTRPTRAQALEIIGIATGEMLALSGGRTPCTDELASGWRSLALYRAAMLCEISYFPEQTNGDQTAFEALRKMWEASAKILTAAVTDQCPLPGADPDDWAHRGFPIGRVPCRIPTTWGERW